MTIRDITSAIVAAVSGTTPTALQRCRDLFMKGSYGELDGRGYFYSRDEALRVAVAIALGRSGIGMREGFEVVGNPAHPIQVAFRLAPGGDDVIVRFYRQVSGICSGAVMLHFNASAVLRETAARLDEALAATARGKPLPKFCAA
jgi:hypothetical protein